MKKFLVIFIGFLLPLISNAQVKSYSVPFSFQIPENLTTSAGVYATDGTLVRTLWNNVNYDAGTYDKSWDGLDDEGLLMNNANYKIIVQTNKIKYEWEGARIGNTSKDLTGGNKHRSYSPAKSMVIHGGYAYYCTGFNEGTSSLYKFALNNKQVIKRVLDMSGHQISATCVATDGKIVYWAGADSWGTGWPAFIVGTKVTDDSENVFSTGKPVTMSQGRTYNSAIDIDITSKISGLAVTKVKNFLFVAHFSANQIRVLNKTTGELLQKIAFNGPKEILVDKSDKYLWVTDGNNQVKKYPINSNGTLGKVALSLSDVINPLAFDISPDNLSIMIADGNNGSEIVSCFSTSTGKKLWSMGKGSYETDPNVTNEKFYFLNRNSAQGTFKTFVSFQPDGSFWIGDYGNYRMQHYSSDRTFIDRIMYLAQSYNCSADINDPTRVFDEYLEFKIDYSKPLAQDNGSWELVRNYRASLKTESYGEDEMRTIFKSVATLSNGKTYATLEKLNKFNIVELPKYAPIRFTGIEYDNDKSVLIMKDGSVRSYINRREPKLASFYTQDLKGFDPKGNPVLSNRYALSEIPVLRSDPHDYNQNRNGQNTSSGLLISFMKGAGVEDTGYHLGAIRVGDDKFLWKTSKSTPASYRGDFPTDGTFDIGNGVTGHSAGAGVFVVDNHIFWNYNGEFWKNSQTNYWNQFSDIGLMVGQFGTWGGASKERGPFGMAGNAFSGNVVKVGNFIYIYQNDESQHSGIHRWKISDLNSIKQINIPIELQVKGNGLTAKYFKGVDLDNANLKVSRIDPLVDFDWTDKSPDKSNFAINDQFSGLWSGFVLPLFSENYTFYIKADDGVRLWIGGKLIIDKWQDKSTVSEYSGNINLTAGKRYSIRLEYYKKVGNNKLTLLWKSAKQNKKVIPSANLFPTETEDSSSGINLMEGLSNNGLLIDGMYGWSRYPKNEDNTQIYEKWWSVKTGIKSFKSPDIYVIYRQPNNSKQWVTRNLGVVSESLTQWKLIGNVSYEGNYDNTTGGGSYIEVLDDNQKVITRIFPHVDQKATLNVNDLKSPIISENSSSDLRNIINKYNQMTITANNKGITVSYGSYNPVTTTIFDPTSNWKKPKSLRFYFFTINKNSGRSISAEGFRFLTTEERENTGAAKKTQKIQFAEIEEQVYGDTLTLDAKASSGLPVSYFLKSGPATLKDEQLFFNGVGKVVIEARQTGNDKFPPAPTVSQEFMVNRAPQVIKLGNPAYDQLTLNTFKLHANASSKLPVTFTVSGPAKIEGLILSLTGVGKVEINAIQGGNDNYLPAKDVRVMLGISETSVRIEFPEIADQKINEPFYLNATASLGSPITYKVLSGPAEISGNKVTFTGVGTVEIIAYATGYDGESSSVSRKFSVIGSDSANPLEFPIAGTNNDMPAEDPKAVLQIYPNPASTGTNIKYLLEGDIFSKIQIYNTQGVLIKSFDNPPSKEGVFNELWFDTSELANGIYIVRLMSAKSTLSKKLIVNK